MKLPRSSGKQKKRKLLIVRRVHGRSMMPYLNPGQIVIAHGLYRNLKPLDVVIIEHAKD
jgi:signal peptidase I